MARTKEVLQTGFDIANKYLEGVAERPVGQPIGFPEMLRRMRVPLSETGEDPRKVLESLSQAAGPGLVATVGPRYFGFVVGGAYPVAVAAEWLVSTWDQNAASYVLSPAAAAVEEVCREWLLELLGLPGTMSAGFTTGATMANFTGLAAARHALLKKLGWDVEARGLYGAPEVTVLTSAESHIAVYGALQLLGLGYDRVVKVETDGQGGMKAEALRNALKNVKGPVIVCAQAGNVDTGAFDPLAEIVEAVHAHDGWVHVDGAFGLWVGASPKLRHLVKGVAHADSIVVDFHKWLNVPQDSGAVFVRDPLAHRTAMTWTAPYFQAGPENARENHNWVPDSSRRARGFAVYATLRAVGRAGLASMIERCCTLAQRMAAKLTANPKVQILNDVVINQVLVRFGTDELTQAVLRSVQEDGTCWAGGTKWHGMQAMRISVSNQTTTEADIDRSAEAILKCLEAQSRQSMRAG